MASEHDGVLNKTKEDITDMFVDIVDNKIGTLTTNEYLKEIPGLKIICIVAQGIVGIRSKYQIKMIEQFINTVNSGVATPGDITIHLNRLKTDPNQLIKEVNYILVKIDSWTDLEKSEYFGNIYVAYIEKKITWNQLTLYTEILGQLIINDIATLEEIHKLYKYDKDSIPPFASMLRLQSLGLVVFHDGFVKQTTKNAISENVKEERGHITGEGKVFYSLITKHQKGYLL